MKKRGTTICCVVCTTLSLLFLGLAIVILVLNEIGFFKEKVDDLVREVWSNEACYNAHIANVAIATDIRRWSPDL